VIDAQLSDQPIAVAQEQPLARVTEILGQRVGDGIVN